MPASTRPPLWSLIVSLLLKNVLAFSQCYYPDGSIPTDYLWEPCTGAKFSSCCVPSEGDICQPDGLCYYPLQGIAYRGACTDRTFNDPSCNQNICVAGKCSVSQYHPVSLTDLGFETTWQWAMSCKGSSDILCGSYESQAHSTPSCTATDATSTAGYITTWSTTTAGRYTPPASVDTKLFTVITSSYTTVITATLQTTTITSTFQSTTTSALSRSPTGSATSASGRSVTANSTSTGIAEGASNPATTSPPQSKSTGKAGKVTLTTGVLAAVIAGPIVLIVICLGVFLFVRKRRAAKSNEATRLNSANLPPNGPVGADQVHPYEVDLNQASAPLREYYNHAGPKVDTYEVDAQSYAMSEKQPHTLGAVELAQPHREELRSPAPTYMESLVPVEMDATPSLRSARGQ